MWNTGSSQAVGVSNEGKATLVENEMTKYDAFTSGRQLGGSNSASQTFYQGSGTQSNRSFDRESPSNLDSTSGISQPHNRSETMNQRDVKSSGKRKRGESSLSWDQNMDNSQIFDSHKIDDQTGEVSKIEMPGNSGRDICFNIVSYRTKHILFNLEYKKHPTIVAIKPQVTLGICMLGCPQMHSRLHRYITLSFPNPSRLYTYCVHNIRFMKSF